MNESSLLYDRKKNILCVHSTLFNFFKNVNTHTPFSLRYLKYRRVSWLLRKSFILQQFWQWQKTNSHFFHIVFIQLDIARVPSHMMPYINESWNFQHLYTKLLKQFLHKKTESEMFLKIVQGLFIKAVHVLQSPFLK